MQSRFSWGGETVPAVCPVRLRTWHLVLAVALPVLATMAFYVHEQGVVQRPVQVDAAALQPPSYAVQFELERNDGSHPRYQHVAGWVVQATDDSAWPQTSVLVVAPDGRATEFRANLRERADLGRLPVANMQQKLAGFDVRIKKRYFPEGAPLKIMLAVTQRGRRFIVDTGAVVQGAS